ncbi:MAG: phage tail protein [Nocardiopsaceae bacterium]|nr:phage tail protein [Nocardiopsaceae bacterium]
MRGAVDGMISPFPLAGQLPGVYAEDEMALRFTEGLDDLFAPLVCVLDCLAAYFDPALAPADFVAWLGGWVGAEAAGDEPEETLRRIVAGAAAAHRLRGTARGVSEVIRLAFGLTAEVIESGGAVWSPRPRGPFPGEPEPRLVVRLRVPDPASVDRIRIERLVAAVRPAHVPCVVEILSMGGSH